MLAITLLGVSLPGREILIVAAVVLVLAAAGWFLTRRRRKGVPLTTESVAMGRTTVHRNRPKIAIKTAQRSPSPRGRGA